MKIADISFKMSGNGKQKSKLLEQLEWHVNVSHSTQPLCEVSSGFNWTYRFHRVGPMISSLFVRLFDRSFIR